MATVDFTCVCGKQIRFKAEHAGKKTKCPDCNATITVPSPEAEETQDYGEYDEESPPTANRSSVVASVTGKRAVVSFGQVVPSMFGRTTLELENGRLIETTEGPLSRRHAELLLTEVDSAELRVQPNPALLGAGLVLLPIFGIGLIVLLVYFYLKYKYLVIHSGNNSMVVAITKNEDTFHDFMDTVLAAAEQAKRRKFG